MRLKLFLKRKYYELFRKIVREKASAEYIARGWAIGMFYGCLIPFGLQLLCSIPTAFLLKGSKIGATLGTLLTNHFTIFLIYPAQCYVGSKLIGNTLSYGKIREALGEVLKNQDYSSLSQLGTELVIAFFLGGALLTAVMTPITYFGVLYLVRKYRARRELRLRKKNDHQHGKPIVKKLFLTLLFPLLLLTGCGRDAVTEIGKLSVFQGGDQCALPGREFAQTLQILVSGPGSADEPPPAPGYRIRFEPAAGSDLQVTPQEAVSDAGGLVRVRVTAGNRIGDQYLRVIPEAAPDRELAVRFITGVELSGIGQQGKAGSLLRDPLSVRLVAADGSPRVGVPVYFQLLDSPSGSPGRVLTNSQLTNERGEAATPIRLGDGTGTYRINLEVAATDQAPGLRGIVVEEQGINYLQLALNVFGGLAIFVFGMKLMSDGLHKAAGERMRSILHFFASNRLVAVAAGTVVTAVIQSSSASTVMVIGFVNAGLLSLAQSIGIIFGANIGTTITAQIIAFDISAITMPAIILGLLLLFITWKYCNGWGETALGFGLLFFGMTIMSNELKSVADFPSFLNFFRTFDCSPVNGVMPFGSLIGTIGIGLLVTVVIQSSSAATGIILALGASGLINFYTAVALVLGANIGTTITAQLAALPANRIAKQAALAHTLFNVFGVVVTAASFYWTWKDTGIPVFFYFINSITGGDVFAATPQNLPRHIANAHTVFNVATTLLLLPFTGVMARICETLLPVRKEKIKYQFLEPHLLDTPSIALEQTVRALRSMLKDSWKMVDQALNRHFLKANVDPEQFRKLARREDKIDRMQAEITRYLVQITRRELAPPQSELIPLLMHCTNDAERIADHTATLLELTRRLEASETKVSSAGQLGFKRLTELLTEMAEAVVGTLESYQEPLKYRALALEQEIRKLAGDLENAHIERLRRGKCNPVVGVIYVEALGEVEKVAGNLANIAERSGSIQKNYLGLRGAQARPVKF